MGILICNVFLSRNVNHFFSYKEWIPMTNMKLCRKKIQTAVVSTGSICNLVQFYWTGFTIENVSCRPGIFSKYPNLNRGANFCIFDQNINQTGTGLTIKKAQNRLLEGRPAVEGAGAIAPLASPPISATGYRHLCALSAHRNSSENNSSDRKSSERNSSVNKSSERKSSEWKNSVNKSSERKSSVNKSTERKSSEFLVVRKFWCRNYLSFGTFGFGTFSFGTFSFETFSFGIFIFGTSSVYRVIISSIILLLDDPYRDDPIWTLECATAIDVQGAEGKDKLFWFLKALWKVPVLAEM